MAYTTINKSSLHMNTKTYTGNGNSSHGITGINFKPDWTWIKSRSNATDHILTDILRAATVGIKSNTTAGNATDGNQLKSFDSDGFTLGSENDVNGSSRTYVAWNWKANGAGSANTAGSINSTVSANTTAGFSIVKYTGTGADDTVGHGLGVAPKMIITKATGTTNNWGTYHESLGNNDAVFLNLTNGTNDYAGYWNTTTPTSSVFSVGVSPDTNSSATMIAYCFAEKQGFSKFGSYVGNGSATNGPFVYTGFKPAFVMVKESSSTGSWCIFDNKRLGYNANNPRLYPNNSNAEDASETIFDIVSNGFKIRGDQSDTNASGQTYIYMAFAEAPLVGTNNVPCTAR